MAAFKEISTNSGEICENLWPVEGFVSALLPGIEVKACGKAGHHLTGDCPNFRKIFLKVIGALAQRLEQGTHNFFRVTFGNQGS
jgi:hypothetical protein